MNEEKRYRAEFGSKMDCPDDYMFGLVIWRARSRHDKTNQYIDFLRGLEGECHWLRSDQISKRIADFLSDMEQEKS